MYVYRHVRVGQRLKGEPDGVGMMHIGMVHIMQYAGLAAAAKAKAESCVGFASTELPQGCPGVVEVCDAVDRGKGHVRDGPYFPTIQQSEQFTLPTPLNHVVLFFFETNEGHHETGCKQTSCITFAKRERTRCCEGRGVDRYG